MSNDQTQATSLLPMAGEHPLTGRLSREWRQLIPAIVVFAGLVAVPVISYFLGHTYYLDLVARIMILGLAAVGLNLILGYGGMVSFGHALYLGLGAYTVGVMTYHGVDSAWLHLLVALVVGLPISLIVGYICLKASGMAFIMITLAFAQMFYYLALGLKQYGGDDGLPMEVRSQIAGLDMENPFQFYFLVLFLLLVLVVVFSRLVRSRFGMVIRASKQNTGRMYALGYPVMRYKVLAYVISAQIVTLAGMLLANLAMFTSPAYMDWTLSGDLILMCVLGGLGTLVGPLVGAIAFVGLEEFLSTMPVDLPGNLNELITTHWLGFFGVIVVLVVIFMRNGIYGVFTSKGGQHD